MKEGGERKRWRLTSEKERTEERKSSEVGDDGDDVPKDFGN